MESFIKNLELTESDFEMITEALDCLPDKNTAGVIITSILGGMLARTDEEREQLLAEKKREHELQQIVRKKQIEEIRLLQGKLLMLKTKCMAKNILSDNTDG